MGPIFHPQPVRTNTAAIMPNLFNQFPLPLHFERFRFFANGTVHRPPARF
jgi:hypothetical protein